MAGTMNVINLLSKCDAAVVAAEKLLLEELILLCRERARQSSGEARNVLTADQMGESRKLFRPSQFIEDAAQMDEEVDTGCRCQRRLL